MCLIFQPFLCDIFFFVMVKQQNLNFTFSMLYPLWQLWCMCSVSCLVEIRKRWDCDVVMKYKKTLLSCLSRSNFLWGFIFCIFVVDRLLMHYLAFCRWWLIITFLRARDSLLENQECSLSVSINFHLSLYFNWLHLISYYARTGVPCRRRLQFTAVI